MEAALEQGRDDHQARGAARAHPDARRRASADHSARLGLRRNGRVARRLGASGRGPRGAGRPAAGRPTRVRAASAAAAPIAPPAAVTPAFVPPAATPYAPPEPEPATARVPSEPPELDEPTLPPPPLAADADFTIDVDVSSGTPEPAAVAGSEAGDGRDSSERLSAAPPAVLEPADSAERARRSSRSTSCSTKPTTRPARAASRATRSPVARFAGDEDDELERLPPPRAVR